MKRLGVILAVLVFTFSLSVSAVFAQPCEGNFDCDTDVDGTDAAVFKEDFGRSQFKNPCPGCTTICDPPAPVQKTGQTDCWQANGDPVLCQTCIIGVGCTNKTGQDGMWEKGVALPKPRFTDNGDGTATDNLTGLIQLKNADCFGPRTWQQALDDCNGLSAGYCGLTDGSSEGDWRLPNRRELFSLIHDGYWGPALTNTAGTGQHTNGDPFNLNYVLPYWSSTSLIGTETQAFTINFNRGLMDTENKVIDSQFVWCVKGGQQKERKGITAKKAGL